MEVTLFLVGVHLPLLPQHIVESVALGTEGFNPHHQLLLHLAIFVAVLLPAPLSLLHHHLQQHFIHHQLLSQLRSQEGQHGLVLDIHQMLLEVQTVLPCLLLCEELVV